MADPEDNPKMIEGKRNKARKKQDDEGTEKKSKKKSSLS